MDTVITHSTFELVDDVPWDDDATCLVDLSDEDEVKGMVARWELDEVDFETLGKGDCSATRLERERKRQGIWDGSDEDLDGLSGFGGRKGVSRATKHGVSSPEGERVTRPPQNPGGMMRPRSNKGLGKASSAVSARLHSACESAEGGSKGEPLGSAAARARASLSGARGEVAQANAHAARYALSAGHRRTGAALGQRALIDEGPTPDVAPVPGGLFPDDKPAKVKARKHETPEPIVPPEGPPRPFAGPAKCDCTCHGQDAENAVEGAVLDDARRRFFPAWVSPGAASDGSDVHHPAESRPCGCTDRSAKVCSDARFGTQRVAVGVDTMHVSFAANVPRELKELLQAKKEETQSGEGVARIELGGVLWDVSPGSGGLMYPFLLKSELGDLAIARRPGNGKDEMTLRFEGRAIFMWNAGPAGFWKWAEAITKAIHVHEEHRPWCATYGDPPGACKCSGPLKVHAKVSRLDPCCDVTGPDFKALQVRHLVMRSRTRTRHNAKKGHGVQVASRRKDAVELDDASGGIPKAPDAQLHIFGDGACAECDGTGRAGEATLAEHFSGWTPTGWSLGSGEILCRIYNKTNEIRVKGFQKAWFYRVWETRGWVATEPVWRIEFQLKREALKELCDVRAWRRLNVDTLDGLVAALPVIWGYLTGGVQGHEAWMKWSKPSPTEKRRSRWDPRPEWKAIQRAALEFTANPRLFPLVRVQRRAAKWKQALAAALGNYGAAAAVASKGSDGRYLEPAQLQEAMLERLKAKGIASFQDYVAAKAVMQDNDAAREHSFRHEADMKAHAKWKAERAERESRKVSA